MKSVDEKKVFRQYLKLLPINALACPLLNYDAKKLSDFSLVKFMIMANISKEKKHPCARTQFKLYNKTV